MADLFNVYAPDPLNPQASVLVDCQTDIKTAIKQGIFHGLSRAIILERVIQLIDRALSKITSNTLKTDAELSLKAFANRVYSSLKTAFPVPKLAVAAWVLSKSVSKQVSEGKTSLARGVFIPKTKAEKTAAELLYGETFTTTAKGIPLQEFQQTYMKRVKEALNKIADERALDPNDVTDRNSLRNLAEMQVRYEAHDKNIGDLVKDGVKLAICSVHADCSKRCSPYQGRVYSLDGTAGVTPDGRKYMPLEYATKNPRDRYTTKAGRTYQNGLFGFNCRHKLYKYTPNMVAPFVDSKTQKKERWITQKQREMERTVIYWRERALMNKGLPDEHANAKAKAEAAFERYKEFSIKNKRAFYPDRVKIL